MKKSDRLIIILFLLILPFCKNINAQWQQTGFENTLVASLTVSGSDLFAGTHNGLYFTSDNGTSWMAANNGLENIVVNSFAVADTNLFAGAIYYGVYLSTNNGTNWISINNGLGDAHTSVTCLGILGSNLFVGTLNDYGIFLSTDNGTNWLSVNNGLANAGNFNSLAVSGSNVFAGTYNNGVYLTTDNGTSWKAVNDGLTNNQVLSFAVSDTNLFAGTANGVYLTTDNGTNWAAVNNGLENNYVISLAISDTYLFAATSNDNIFLSRDNGINWTAVNDGLTNIDIRCLAVLDTDLFLGTNNNGVWKRPLSEMITSVEDENISSSKFLLVQNYPNPFNPSTKIIWQTIVSGWQILKVYDILGREVATLVNEYRPAGSYEVEFKSTVGSHQLANGVYFYRLQAGDFVETKKTILVK